MNFVTDAHKHEGCQEDVEKRLIWNEDQDTFGVVGKPDVVLCYKQLKKKIEKICVRQDGGTYPTLAHSHEP